MTKNKVMVLIDAFGVATLMGLPFLLFGQSSKSKSPIINFDGAPARVKITGKTFAVKNISSQTIAVFQMACVIEKDKGFLVILKFDPKLGKLQPNQSASEIVIDGLNSLELCKNRKARLAVLSVTFEDGKKWTAPIRQKGN